MSAGASSLSDAIMRLRLFLAHTVYVVLDSSRQVTFADIVDVVVDTEVEVEDDTKKNLGSLQKKIFINVF